MTPVYPSVAVQLSDVADQPLAILYRVDTALRQYGVMRCDYDRFVETAISSTPDRLVETCRRWVVVR